MDKDVGQYVLDKEVRDHLRWYERSARNMALLWVLLQVVVLLAGTASVTLTATLTKSSNIDEVKFFIVGLTALVTVSSTVLGQFRIYEMWKLREDGRIDAAEIRLAMQLREAERLSGEEHRTFDAEIATRLIALERRQASSFFSLSPPDAIAGQKRATQFEGRQPSAAAISQFKGSALSSAAEEEKNKSPEASP